MAAAVVAHNAANLFGDGIEICDQVVNRLGGQRRKIRQGAIHIVDVGLVVLVVVQLHRLSVDERFKCGVVVGQRCEFISHRGKSSVRIVL